MCDKQSATLARALWQLGAVSACSAVAFWVLQSDGGGVGRPSGACSAGRAAQLGPLRSAAQGSSDRSSARRTELTARNGSWAACSVLKPRAYSYAEQQSLAEGVLPVFPNFLQISKFMYKELFTTSYNLLKKKITALTKEMVPRCLAVENIREPHVTTPLLKALRLKHK